MCLCGTVAQLLELLALPPHSKKVMGLIPTWGAVGTGGAGPPQGAQCSSGLSPGPFCVEFACSPRDHKGFPLLRTPTGKHAKRTEQSCPSPTETDSSLGPRALRSCPLLLGGPGGRTSLRCGSITEVARTSEALQIPSPRPSVP